MNIYILIAGIIGVFNAIGHGLGGHKTYYQKYLKLQFPTHDLKKTLQIVWHTITINHLLVGLILVYVGLSVIPATMLLFFLVFHELSIALIHLWSTFDTNLENRGFHAIPFITHALIAGLCFSSLG